jgi:predicted enzyme related to lactoylglutathione lyase
MTHLKIDYVELATPDIAASKTFLARAFGWSFVDYGPEYAAFADAGLDGGLDGHSAESPAPPLVILKADDLEAAFAAVTAAGGTITRPIFSFPGGRRFQFREPGGNEMAVWGE